MTPEKINLLLIDDDPALLAVLELGLRIDASMEVIAVSTAAAGVRLLAEQCFDLVITDYSLDDAQINGMEIMRHAHRRENPPLVILITAFASMELTLEAIRLGAYDFLTKPFQLEELQLVVRNAAERIRLEQRNRTLLRRATELEAALDTLEHEQQTLTSRIEQLTEDLQRTGIHESHPTRGHVQLADPLRRRYQDQLDAYLKQSHNVSTGARNVRSGLQPGASGAEPMLALDPSIPSVEA